MYMAFPSQLRSQKKCLNSAGSGVSRNVLLPQSVEGMEEVMELNSKKKKDKEDKVTGLVY